jgi:CubicO group peptidase (beta-lactamase class C family)
MDQRTRAASMGFAPDRLARIDRHLKGYVEAGKLPCAQFVLARQGQVVHQSIVGQQDPERGVALAEDTVYRIYSMTKPITAVALMTLVEEGLIDLGDPVAKYIPEWADLGVFSAGIGVVPEGTTVFPGMQAQFITTPPARPMQVVDLLRHTSGLTYGFQNRTNVDATYRALKMEDFHAGHDLQGFVEALAKVPLEFSPGEAWNYSVSTDVVGYLVQKVAGKPLSQVFQERIFDPLKMTDTGFFVREDQRSRFAACYNAVKGGIKLQDDPSKSPYLKPPSLESGGGGLVSTAADYTRFAAMLLNGGELDGARILAPKTVRLMASNHLPGGKDLTEMSRSLFSESTYAGIGFGLGVAVVFDAPRTLMPVSNGEFYWGGAASTAFWVDPVEEVTAVFMTQLLPSTTYQLRRELRILSYGALIDSNA